MSKNNPQPTIIVCKTVCEKKSHSAHKCNVIS